GPGIEHDLDAPGLGMKIWHEHFNDHGWIGLADRGDRSCEMVGAAVLEIVARHRGDDDVLQAHASHGFGHPLWFVFLEGERFGGCDRAKPAGAGATFARDHHRRGALAPAFPAVWTLGAFTYGVQP